MHNSGCTINLPFGRSIEKQGVRKLKGFRVKPFLKKGLQGYGDWSPPIVTEVSAYGANKNRAAKFSQTELTNFAAFFCAIGSYLLSRPRFERAQRFSIRADAVAVAKPPARGARQGGDRTKPLKKKGSEKIRPLNISICF